MDGGGCSSDAELCGDAWVITSCDLSNCGRCGHSCGGGGCSAGLCQPIVVSTFGGSLSPNQHIAVDDANVYWTSLQEGGAVMSCPKDGCDGGPAILTSTTSPSALAVADQTVYFGQDIPGGGNIFSCPTTGCAAAPTSLNAKGYAGTLSVYDGTVYWTYAPGPPAVYACVVDSGVCPPNSISSATSPWGLAVEDSGIYWTQQPPRLHERRGELVSVGGMWRWWPEQAVASVSPAVYNYNLRCHYRSHERSSLRDHQRSPRLVQDAFREHFPALQRLGKARWPDFGRRATLLDNLGRTRGSCGGLDVPQALPAVRVPSPRAGAVAATGNRRRRHVRLLAQLRHDDERRDEGRKAVVSPLPKSADFRSAPSSAHASKHKPVPRCLTYAAVC